MADRPESHYKCDRKPEKVKPKTLARKMMYEKIHFITTHHTLLNFIHIS